jgi:hypothetical protein
MLLLKGKCSDWFENAILINRFNRNCHNWYFPCNADGSKGIVIGVRKTSNPKSAAEWTKQSFAAAFHHTKRIALGNDFAETLLRRGDAYLLEGRTDLALTDYRTAVKRSPNDPTALARYNFALGLLLPWFTPKSTAF